MVALHNKQYHAQVILDLNEAVKLHDAQKAVAKAIFIDGKKRVFVEAGRKTGKTTLVPYSAYRKCMMKPNTVCYIIAPFFKQAKELLWSDHRITHFLPKHLAEKYGVTLNNTELRVSFGNGSFIKLEGSDNTEAGRGVNPDFVVFDEMKDINETFFLAMEPNLAARDGVMLAIGTPPETENNLFCKLADEIKADTIDGAYFNFPSWVNPYLKKDWFIKQKKRLIDRGEWDVWMREYEAKRVVGGSNALFPMFSRKKHVVNHDELVAKIRSRIKDYDLFYGFDPGSASVFGGLCVAIHKHTKKVSIINEIYEKNPAKMSTGTIYPRARDQMDAITSVLDRWNEVYDNAATWFANEVRFSYDRSLTPCEKDVKTKNDKLSMMKDMFEMDFIEVSDKCVNFISEIENMIRDEKGKIDKCADHCTDCFRYILNLFNYEFTPDMAIKTVDDEKRFYRMDEERRTDEDPVYGMLDWLYE